MCEIERERKRERERDRDRDRDRERKRERERMDHSYQNADGGCQCSDAQITSEDGNDCTCQNLYVKWGSKCCEYLNYVLDEQNLCNRNYGCGWGLDVNSAGDRTIFSEVTRNTCFGSCCPFPNQGTVYLLFYNGEQWIPVYIEWNYMR